MAVTKYRKAMSIRSSRERKDWAAISAHPPGEHNGKHHGKPSEPVGSEDAPDGSAAADQAADPEPTAASELESESGQTFAAIDHSAPRYDAIFPPAPEEPASESAAADSASNNRQHAAAPPPVSMPRAVLPVAKSIFPE